MNAVTDRIRGLVNEAAGNIKQGFGKLTGNMGLRTEGKVQEMKGRGQQTLGNVKARAKGAANRHL